MTTFTDTNSNDSSHSSDEVVAAGNVGGAKPARAARAARKSAPAYRPNTGRTSDHGASAHRGKRLPAARDVSDDDQNQLESESEEEVLENDDEEYITDKRIRIVRNPGSSAATVVSGDLAHSDSSFVSRSYCILHDS